MRFKRITLFLAFLSNVLTSCNFNDPQITPFNLSSKYYESGALVDVMSKEAFNALTTNKESFIIYQYLESCMGCFRFAPYLTEFIETEQITVLQITIDISAETILTNYSAVSPTVFLFDQGQYKTHLDPTKKEHASAFTSTEALTVWFKTYVNIPAVTST